MEMTVDQHRFIETELRIQHRHGDGGWGALVEERSHESAADHDLERAWSSRRIFACTSCSEKLTVLTGPDAVGDAG